MLIVSEDHDYDAVGAQGVDKTVVYNRKELTLVAKYNTGKREYELLLPDGVHLPHGIPSETSRS